MSMYAASAPVGGGAAKASPRRQPVVPPRKPIDMQALRAKLSSGIRPAGHGGGAPASSDWQGVPEARWKAITFADIPASAFDHLLEELLKGMLYETTLAAEQQIVKAASVASSRAPATGRTGTASARGVLFGSEEPTPLTAGPSVVAAGPSIGAGAGAGGGGGSGLLGGVPSMYARLHQAYNAVMSEFATTEAERDEARAALFGGGGSNGSSPSSTNASTPVPVAGSDSSAKASFSATVGQLGDKRVKQYERMLQASREEVGDLAAQLEDLRLAHEQVHADLNRSYREYDKVQRQLLAAMDRERQRAEELAERDRRKHALAERQDARWKTKVIGQLPGEGGGTPTGADL